MPDKKTTEIRTSNFMMTLIKTNQRLENVLPGLDKKISLSTTTIKNSVEQKCKHRTENGFCNRSKKQCIHFPFLINKL